MMLQSVRLVQEIGLPGPLEFRSVAGEWALCVDLPAVDRMEYLFEVEDHNGYRRTILDPANPRRVPGAFGDKSEAVFAGYRAPAWLDAAAGDARVDDFAADGFPVRGSLWSPATLAPDEPAPLLVVHDGPEYARIGGLTGYLSVLVGAGVLPPVRALLLGPGDRNDWYSANAGYAAALCRGLLPQLEAITTRRVGIGVSLGGLAMLHAHHCHPGVFGGLLLQSGSFFTAALDPQEKGFSGFAAVTGFVATVTGADGPDGTAVPAVLTCGTVEENLANNRAMAAALRGRGYPVELVEVRDAHNYTAWRDALDPHLTRLVTSVVNTDAP
jgi:enterochelin esterase family protein